MADCEAGSRTHIGGVTGEAWRSDVEVRGSSAVDYAEETQEVAVPCDWCKRVRPVTVWMGWQVLCRPCWREAQREWYDDSEGRSAR